MAQGNMPPITLNAFSVMSTWLNADPVEGSQKRPSLRFGVFGNVPRITVKTNVQGDINHGKIEFNCDLATFAAAMAYATDLAISKENTPPERKFIYQNDYVAGKKLDKIIPLTTLVIGREQQSGRIYIALLSSQQSRPRIRFFFGPSKYHNILNGDGSQITPKEMSEAYAIGFLKPAEQIIYHMMVSSFDPDAKNVSNPAKMNGGQGGGGGGYQQRPQQNNGGGGYQQRPQSNGGYNAPSNDFDAGIPDF